MRVGVLTTSYPRDRHDWAGHFVRGFARWLHGSGHDVTVLCASDGARRRDRDDGFEVRRIPGRGLFYRGGAPEALGRIGAWPRAVPFVAELAVRARALRHQVDALVSHWLIPCGILGALSGGKRHLVVVHSGDVHLLERLGRPVVRASARILARSGARVAFASPALRDRLLEPAHAEDRHHLIGRSEIVSMGIDVEMLRPRVPRVARKGGLTVAFVGRPSPIKGLDVLRRAAAGLDGIDLRVAEGGVVGEDKRAFLEAADVLVVPSLELPDGRTEGTPTVVLEGMAAGLAVIASRTGGIPEVLKDEATALLVTPGSEAELRAALCRLRDDVALRTRLSTAALAGASRHDWSVVGPRLAALL